MDVRAGGAYRFRTAFGVVEGEFREVEAPERLVQLLHQRVLAPKLFESRLEVLGAGSRFRRSRLFDAHAV